MAYIKGIVRGNLENIKQQDVDTDKLYVVKDLPDNSITNQQMELAVNDNSAAAFFRVNNTYICIDEGIYTKNHIYKWLGDSWEDITPVSDAEIDDITITKNSEDKIQATGITDGESMLNFSDIYQAVSTNWEV